MNRLPLLLGVVFCIMSCHILKPKHKREGPEGFVNKIEFKEYVSLGSEFNALQDVFLKVDSISFLGKSTEKVKGVTFESIHYRLSVELRLSFACELTPSDNHTHTAYPKKIDYELSVVETMADSLYQLVLDSIYVKYQNVYNKYQPQTEETFVHYELGAFQFSEHFYLFINGALTSILDPIIICTPQKAIFLRVSENTPEALDYFAWATNFMLYDVTRGIRIKQGDLFFDPSLSNLLNRNTFLEKYQKRLFEFNN